MRGSCVPLQPSAARKIGVLRWNKSALSRRFGSRTFRLVYVVELPSFFCLTRAMLARRGGRHLPNRVA
jgi:hypothetical protein